MAEKKQKYGEVLVTLQDIDFSIVKELEKHTDLLDNLYDWMWISAWEYLPKIIELSKIYNELYTKPKELVLYRGVKTDDPDISDTMGLKKPVIVGSKHRYASNNRAISFTEDIAIARVFGRAIVKTTLLPKQNYMQITKEMLYVIYKDHILKKQRKDVESQLETILLPPFDIQFEIVEYDNSFFWTPW